MINLRLYLDYEQVKELTENEADCTIVVVEDKENGKYYSLGYETQGATTSAKLFLYERLEEAVTCKTYTFDLFDDLCECSSNAEMVKKILDYLGI